MIALPDKVRKDLKGKVFGNDCIVKEFAGFNNQGRTTWICECGLCKQEFTLTSSQVKTRLQCRICSNKKVNLENRTHDLTGLKFGDNCEVLFEVPKKEQDSESKHRYWRVKCKCGKQFDARQANIIRDDKKLQGCKSCANEKLREMWTGDKSLWWKGGKSKLQPRGSKRLAKARKEVLKRDNYKCYITGSTENLEIHHLDSWDTNQECRFNPNNMITLTHNIHRLFHDIYGLGNNTREQFNDFVKTLSL